jgi:hypothetical protein
MTDIEQHIATGIPTDDSSIVDITVDTSPLTTEQARQLTSTIRDAAEVLWVLIARAHAGKAWAALGYASWERYVKDEFNMSRSRSYQLLDQARVIAAIEAAVPSGTRVHLNEAAARDLKTVIEEAVPEIRERTEGLAPDDASELLEQMLADKRASVVSVNANDDLHGNDAYDNDPNITTMPSALPYGAQTSGTTEQDPPLAPSTSLSALGAPAPASPATPTDGIDVAKIRRNVNAAHDLYSSLSALAGLPDDLESVVAIIPAERRQVINANLKAAHANLEHFIGLWDTANPGTPE